MTCNYWLIKINKSLKISVERFSTAVVIVDTKVGKQVLEVKQKHVKNPNWQEVY